MTKLLRDTLVKVEQLPEAEQDALAELLLAELISEERWGRAICDSADRLEALADQAWGEHKSGQSQPLDPDRL